MQDRGSRDEANTLRYGIEYRNNVRQKSIKYEVQLPSGSPVPTPSLSLLPSLNFRSLTLELDLREREMKITLVSLFAVSAFQGVHSWPGSSFHFPPFSSPPSIPKFPCFSCKGQRNSSIFISKHLIPDSDALQAWTLTNSTDPAAQPALPSAQQASNAAASAGLNLTDIQGDIL